MRHSAFLVEGTRKAESLDSYTLLRGSARLDTVGSSGGHPGQWHCTDAQVRWDGSRLNNLNNSPPRVSRAAHRTGCALQAGLVGLLFGCLGTRRTSSPLYDIRRYPSSTMLT